MLYLTRKEGQRIVVDDGLVYLKVITIWSDKVMIGFDASADVSIHREEVYQKMLNQKLMHEFSQQQKRMR